MKLAPVFAAFLAVGMAACSSGSDSDGASAGRGAGDPSGLNRPGGVTGSGNFRPGSQEELAGAIGDRVFFASDSATVGADQRPVLERQAEWLNRYRQVQVRVEGHADERGTREYNLALGQRRGVAARDVLVASGVAGTRIQVVSFGKDRPQDPGSGPQAWAQNRRAVTIVR
jgi:peptidoglycan-associated lipoprotein